MAISPVTITAVSVGIPAVALLAAELVRRSPSVRQVRVDEQSKFRQDLIASNKRESERADAAQKRADECQEQVKHADSKVDRVLRIVGELSAEARTIEGYAEELSAGLEEASLKAHAEKLRRCLARLLRLVDQARAVDGEE